MPKTANISRSAPARAAARRRRSRLSLSLRFSLLMLLAALLPLAVVVGVNDYFTRQTLIQQSVNVLPSDAGVTASRINDYFRERLLDGVALSSLETAPKFLTCVVDQAQTQAIVAQGGFAQLTPDCAANFQAYGQSVGRALAVGVKRDANYTLWNMYLAGKAPAELLSSDMATLNSGKKTPAPAQEVATVMQGQQAISPVYYDKTGNYAYVRLYTPIFQSFPPSGQVMGFLQATLKLDAVWGFVSQGARSDGNSGGAFIIDNNGVRVADTDASARFTAVAPLTAQSQAQISALGLYGLTASPDVRALPQVAAASTNVTPQTTFQSATTPGGQTMSQFAAVKTQAFDQLAALRGKAPSNILPWTYFLDSPISAVTSVATQQVELSLISAAIVAVIAALIGLWIGARTASPVEQSAERLEGAAGVLKALAARQESAAGEQSWVVDACKTGIDGVRYLADAMNQAARRIVTAANWFDQYWHRLDEDQARATVQHLRELAAYIDEAARRQQASSDRLDKAITVTMQVSHQLVTGASEATHSADQLDMVLRELQSVIGGRVSAAADRAAEEEMMRIRVEQATGAVPAIGGAMGGQMGQYGQMGQMALPAPGVARPMSAPPSGRIAARAPSFRLNPASEVSEDWGAYSQYGGPMGPVSQYGGVNGGNGGQGGRQTRGAQFSQWGGPSGDQNGQNGQNGW